MNRVYEKKKEKMKKRNSISADFHCYWQAYITFFSCIIIIIFFWNSIISRFHWCCCCWWWSSCALMVVFFYFGFYFFFFFFHSSIYSQIKSIRFHSIQSWFIYCIEYDNGNSGSSKKIWKELRQFLRFILDKKKRITIIEIMWMWLNQILFDLYDMLKRNGIYTMMNTKCISRKIPSERFFMYLLYVHAIFFFIICIAQSHCFLVNLWQKDYRWDSK